MSLKETGTAADMFVPAVGWASDFLATMANANSNVERWGIGDVVQGDLLGITVDRLRTQPPHQSVI